MEIIKKKEYNLKTGLIIITIFTTIFCGDNYWIPLYFLILYNIYDINNKKFKKQ